MVDGIVSLISLSDFSLLVYKSARYFCVLARFFTFNIFLLQYNINMGYQLNGGQGTGFIA